MEQSKDPTPEPSVFPRLPSEEAARQVVIDVWLYIIANHVDWLPDDVASIYVGNPHISNLFFSDSSGFQKAACICEIFARKIARAIRSDSGGWITISDAETLTGITKGEFSRDCNKGVIETNGEKGLARRLSIASLWIT